MRRYDERILNKLLDKYENSLLYTGQNQRRQTISVSITKAVLLEYFDESSMQFETIHAQLTELEQKGYCLLVWKNKKAGHILEKCVLCPEKADEIYAYLNRRPKQEKENRILEICGAYNGKHPVLDHFLAWIRTRLQEGKSIRQYVDTDKPEQFSEHCRLILAILTNTEEVFWREFSVRFLNDSKIAERGFAVTVSVIQHFWEDDKGNAHAEAGENSKKNPGNPGSSLSLKNLEPEQVLEEFGIYKNPSWVMLKGCGRFYIEDEQNQKPVISLESFPGGLGLNSTDIASVRWDTSNPPHKVVTIENLTSFHRFSEEGTLAIYLGGYHNKVKRQFLKHLYENINAEYEHFGDIDCGGFQIWKDLCEKTGIPFRTRRMDVATYLKYADYGKELTEHDRKTLRRMAEEPFYAEQKELFALMLETGKKLEQECVRE